MLYDDQIKKIMAELQKPFRPEEIEWRVGSTNADKTKGIALAYVTNRAIQNRLDEIFGPFGWKNEFREWKGNSQLCGISIRFGDEWITKWDGADDSNMEAVKGGLSDAMKRAAYQWGIGRYLYNLENVWVPIEKCGNSYRLKYEPRLPDWALPEGYKYPDDKPAATHQKTDIPPESLKQKYQQFKGSMDGFEGWVKSQQAKGRNFKDMEKILASALAQKQPEGGAVNA